MSEIKYAQILVDWHNLQARIDEEFNKDPRRKIKPLVLRIQQQTAKVLTKSGGGKRFRASIRIYYGWHVKREATPFRREFERYRFDQDFARTIGLVSFTAGYEFGNELSCYDDPMPLYDTYRGGGQDEGQKMVDTAITCDLLHQVRTHPDMYGIVISDDDDYLPAIITARHWSPKSGGRSVLLRVLERDLRIVTDDSVGEDVYYWSEP